MDQSPTPRSDGISLSIGKAAALGALILGLGATFANYHRERAAPPAAAGLVEGRDAQADRTGPAAGSVRAGPAPDRSPGPDRVSLDHLPADLRREIFVAHHRVRTAAEEAAEAVFPLAKAPDDADSRKLYLAKRDANIEANEDSGRQSLLNRYGIDAEQLAAIDDEGLTNHWTYSLPEDVEQNATRGLQPGRRGGGGRRGRSGGGGRRR